MKAIRKCCAIVAACLLVLPTFPTIGSAAGPDVIDGYTYDAALSDEFEGASLDGWSWVGAQNSKGIVNGHLQVNSFVASPSSSENTATMSEAIEGDFLYELSFKTDAGAYDNQNIGIFLWDGSWDNRFHYQIGCKGSNYFIIHSDNNTSGNPQVTADADGYFKLRIVREGNQFTLQYVDKSTREFVDKQTVTLDWSTVRIGLFARYSNYNSYPASEEAPENFTTDFDYARVYTKSTSTPGTDPVEPDEIEGYTYSETLSSEFDSFDGWGWVGADNSEGIQDGHLLVNSYVESPTTSENTATRIEGIEGDFLYELSFKTDAGAYDNQNAGIFLWNGTWGDNMFQYQVGSKGSNYFIVHNDSNTSGNPQVTADEDGYFKLRIVREGNQFTLQYVDMATGQFVDKQTVTLNLDAVRIGLFARYGDIGTYPGTATDPKNFNVSFDYARVYTKDASAPDPDPVEPDEIEGYTYSATLSNEFNGSDFGGWYWLRGDNMQNGAVSSGHLDINSQVGQNNSWSNVLLSNKVVTGDFIYIAKVKPNVSGLEGGAVGIQLYTPSVSGATGDPATAGNPFEFFAVGKGGAAMVIDHTAPKGNYPVPTTDADGYMYFKVERSGDDFTLSYSADGKAYTVETAGAAQAFQPALGDSIQIGLFAQMRGSAAHFTANFDYARVYTKDASTPDPDPDVPEIDGYEYDAALSDEFTSSTVDDWNWVDRKNAKVENGHLDIYSQVFEGGQKSNENMALMPTTVKGDFLYDVRLDVSDMDQQLQQAGILLYEAWGRDHRFTVEVSVGGTLLINYPGHPNSNWTTVTPDAEGYVYLRVVRTGDVYSYQYKDAQGVFVEKYKGQIPVDGDALDPAATKLGLLAQLTDVGKAPTNEDDPINYSAKFDYARVYNKTADTPDPDEPEITEIDGYAYDADCSDEFSGTALDGWNWIAGHNEAVADGHLKINSYVEGAGSSENTAYQTLPIEGDFLYEIRFKPGMAAVEDQMVGIFLYGGSWDNKFSFQAAAKDTGAIIINHDQNNGSWPEIAKVNDLPADGYLYLRIVKKGTNYTLYYKDKSGNFVEKQTVTLDFDPLHVGLFVRYSNYGGAYPESPDDPRNFTAEIDYARVYRKAGLTDQTGINELPADIPDEGLLNIVSMQPRQGVKPGSVVTVKFNNAIDGTPAFRVSRNKQEVAGAVASVEKVDDTTFRVTIADNAALEAGAIYTLYADATDVYGNVPDNNAGFQIFQESSIPEDVRNKYEGYIYDELNSDEFDGTAVNPRWTGADGATLADGRILFTIQPNTDKFLQANLGLEGDFIIEAKGYHQGRMATHDQGVSANLLVDAANYANLKWAYNSNGSYLLIGQVSGDTRDWPQLQAKAETEEVLFRFTRTGNTLTTEASPDNGATWVKSRSGVAFTGAPVNIQIGEENPFAATVDSTFGFDYVRIYLPVVTQPRMYKDGEMLDTLVPGEYNLDVEVSVNDFSGSKNGTLVAALIKTVDGVEQAVAAGTASAAGIMGTETLKVTLPVNITEAELAQYTVKTFLWDGLGTGGMHPFVQDASRPVVNVKTVNDIPNVYADQASITVGGTLDKTDAATLTLYVADESGAVRYITEKEVSGGTFTHTFGLPAGLPGGTYTLYVSTATAQTGISKQFEYVANVADILTAINGAFQTGTLAALQAALTQYADDLGMTASDISAVSQAAFDSLKPGAPYAQLSAFSDGLTAARLLDAIGTAASAQQIGTLLTGASIEGVNMGEGSDFAKLADPDGVYSFIYNSSERALIDALGRTTLVRLFDTGVALQLINEITTANRTDIRTILSDYQTELDMDSAAEWDYYTGLGKEAQESIVIKLAGDVIGGTVFATTAQLRAAFDTAAEEYRKGRENIGGGGGGGGSSTSGGTKTDYALPPVNPQPLPGDQPIDEIFTDLGGYDWAFEAIKTLYDRDIVSGVAEGQFAPGDNVTREQFAKLLVEAFGLYDATATAAFEDVPAGNWAYAYIASANAAGVVKGQSDTQFGLGQPITREDMAVMAYRALQTVRGTLEAAPEAPFADRGDISDYAGAAIDYMADNNIINGVGDNLYSPKAIATRAQAAKIIAGLLGLS